jgi:hypothetical protein
MQDAERLAIGEYRSGTRSDLVLYDFGAALVITTIPLEGELSGLLTLSHDLYDIVLLLADSRKRVDQLLAAIQPAVLKPEIADFVEDYAIFQIESFTTPCDVPELCTAYAQGIAQLLRAEQQLLSQQEVSDTLTHRIVFGVADGTIIAWNVALMVDPDRDKVGVGMRERAASLARQSA